MKEFCVSLRDEIGQLAKLADELAIHDVNIRTVAGINAANPVVLLVTDHEERTASVLEKLGHTFEMRELIKIGLLDEPGELANCCRKLADAGINIEAIYMIGQSGRSVEMAIHVSHLEEAKKILKHYIR